jgi:cytidylate kinase
MAALKKKPAGIGVFRTPTEQEKSQYIGSLVDQWERLGREKQKVDGTHPFVTISRQVGCMGFDVGLKLSQRLSEEKPDDAAWMVYDKEIVHLIAKKLKMSDRLVEVLTERSYSRISDYMDSFFKGRPTIDAIQKESARIVRGLCEKGHCIIIGRGGCLLGAEAQGGIHLRLVAPFSWRAEQTATAHNLSNKEAEQRVRLLDSEREEHFEKLYGRSIADPDLYDLILNEARFAPDQLIDLVIQAMKARGVLAT